MNTYLTAIYNFIATTSPAFRVAIGLGSFFVAVNAYINSLWSDLFGRLDGIVAGSFGNADFSPLGFVNYVFPLDSICTFLVSYAVLRVSCAGIRMIKSFIPTIS